jgi:hypothetical protein
VRAYAVALAWVIGGAALYAFQIVDRLLEILG